MKKIIDIKINEDICLESSPCEHYIEIIYEDGESKSTCMDAVDIESLLISLKKKVPKHFKNAAEDAEDVEMSIGLFD